MGLGNYLVIKPMDWGRNFNSSFLLQLSILFFPAVNIMVTELPEKGNGIT